MATVGFQHSNLLFTTPYRLTKTDHEYLPVLQAYFLANFPATGGNRISEKLSFDIFLEFFYKKFLEFLKILLEFLMIP